MSRSEEKWREELSSECALERYGLLLVPNALTEDQAHNIRAEIFDNFSDKRVVQLIEMGQWSEEDALGRIQYVLQSAESGDIHVQLEPPRDEGDGVVPGR